MLSLGDIISTAGLHAIAQVFEALRLPVVSAFAFAAFQPLTAPTSRERLQVRKARRLEVFGWASRKASPKPAQSRIEMPRLCLQEQFTLSTAIVEVARARSLEAVALQDAALTKVDSAEYALHRLLDELGSVMPQFKAPAFANVPGSDDQIVADDNAGLALAA